MIMLRRTDAERNMHRFYALGVMPTLFGEWTVVAEWGRIGSPGRVQGSTYADEVSAMKAFAARLTEKSGRGYRSTAQSLVRCYLAGDEAVSVWSDGSTTTSPCKPVVVARKASRPTGEPTFDW